jgi:hypothetical protein
MQLDNLLSFGCDVELRLNDGTMPASSVAVRMINNVFGNALDAEVGSSTPDHADVECAQCCCSSSSSSNAASPTILPLPGMTKAQWRRVAAFVYPVAPAPQIRDWGEAGYLLSVSMRFLSNCCSRCIVVCFWRARLACEYRTYVPS